MLSRTSTFSEWVQWFDNFASRASFDTQIRDTLSLDVDFEESA